jgi:hypothetical protein
MRSAPRPAEGIGRQSASSPSVTMICACPRADALPEPRRSPAIEWAAYVATVRLLARESLVNRELLDVRRPLQLGAGGAHRSSEARLERVEVLA